MIPSASADTWDKKTNVTFSEPVEFPGGTVLAPGSYVLKLLNSSSNRHIVQVYNKDQNHMLAMVMTNAAQRLEPADKTIITFYEAPKNEPVLIHTWFYPGDTVGQDFAYPKGRVRYSQSVSATTTAVVAQAAPIKTETVEREETHIALAEPPAPRAEIKTVQEVAQAPAEEPVLLAQAAPASQAIPETRVDTVTTEAPAPAPSDQLPQTASDAPMWAAGSILLLLSAFLLRTARLVRG
jgi:hypothetical protein